MRRQVDDDLHAAPFSEFTTVMSCRPRLHRAPPVELRNGGALSLRGVVRRESPADRPTETVRRPNARQGGIVDILILAAAVAAMPTAQNDSASVAGTWQGRTFIRLASRTVDGSLTGRISTGDIQVDDQGDLRQVGEPPNHPTPIFDVAPKRRAGPRRARRRRASSPSSAAQRRQRRGRRRVAGDDQQLDPPREQLLGDLEREASSSAGVRSPYGKRAASAEVDEVLVRAADTSSSCRTVSPPTPESKTPTGRRRGLGSARATTPPVCHAAGRPCGRARLLADAVDRGLELA